MSHTPKMVLSLRDVAAICATAKSTKTRTRFEAWTLIKLSARRLNGLSLDTLVIAPDVRLPKDAVVRLLWTIYKNAKAQHAALKAAELVEAERAENSRLEAEREADTDSPYAELPWLTDAHGEPLFVG